MKLSKKYLLGIVFLVAACHSKPPEFGTDDSLGKNPNLTNLPPIAVITVSPENADPYALVTLDGSGSYDTDSGTIKSYSWEQINGEEVVLSDETAVATSFIVPNSTTTLSFQLIVTDQYNAESEPVSVSLQVTATVEPEPEPTAIYVSASLGSDSQDNSGSHIEPTATINHGIALAVEKGLQNVYVMQGNYTEEVNLSSGVHLIGDVTGAGSDGTPVFSTGGGKISLITAPAGAESAVNISGAEDFLLQDFAITGTVLIENSSNGEIVDNEFSAGGEDLKAISAKDSDNLNITDNVVSATVPDDAIVFVFQLNDTANSQISDNTINIQGGDYVTGISLGCQDTIINSTIEHNTIELNGASAEASAVGVKCFKEASVFNVMRNKIILSPSANSAVDLYGVTANMNLRPATLYIANNIIIMDAVSEGDDSADKSGVNLAKLGAQSKVDILHNTVIITGKYGYIYAVSSDVNNVEFSTINNIFFVFGSSNKNAMFKLKKSCGVEHCASAVENNLINPHFFNKNVNYIYYYDTKEYVAMNLVPPSNFKEDMNPWHFDLDDGTLLENYQLLAKDKGSVGLGITTDINGNLRDALPDIGATEY